MMNRKMILVTIVKKKKMYRSIIMEIKEVEVFLITMTKKQENPKDPSFINEETICQIKSHGIPIHAKISGINRSTQLHYVNIKTKIQKRQLFLVPYQCHSHGNYSIQDSLYKYRKWEKKSEYPYDDPKKCMKYSHNNTSRTKHSKEG